jgi:hypothetical protein
VAIGFFLLREGGQGAGQRGRAMLSKLFACRVPLAGEPLDGFGASGRPCTSVTSSSTEYSRSSKFVQYPSGIKFKSAGPQGFAVPQEWAWSPGRRALARCVWVPVGQSVEPGVEAAGEKNWTVIWVENVPGHGPPTGHSVRYIPYKTKTADLGTRPGHQLGHQLGHQPGHQPGHGHFGPKSWARILGTETCPGHGSWARKDLFTTRPLPSRHLSSSSSNDFL